MTGQTEAGNEHRKDPAAASEGARREGPGDRGDEVQNTEEGEPVLVMFCFQIGYVCWEYTEGL